MIPGSPQCPQHQAKVLEVVWVRVAEQATDACRLKRVGFKQDFGTVLQRQVQRFTHGFAAPVQT